jgi:hypothetical protein
LNKLYKRGEFHCLNNNLNFFQNDGNLWSIFFKLNIENFKWLLKAIIFQIDPNKFPKNWPLENFEIYKLTYNFNFQNWPKNWWQWFFLLLHHLNKRIEKQKNFIESFELSRILNSLKFLNYLIQTYSKI